MRYLPSYLWTCVKQVWCRDCLVESRPYDPEVICLSCGLRQDTKAYWGIDGHDKRRDARGGSDARQRQSLV